MKFYYYYLIILFIIKIIIIYLTFDLTWLPPRPLVEEAEVKELLSFEFEFFLFLLIFFQYLLIEVIESKSLALTQELSESGYPFHLTKYSNPFGVDLWSTIDWISKLDLSEFELFSEIWLFLSINFNISGVNRPLSTSFKALQTE